MRRLVTAFLILVFGLSTTLAIAQVRMRLAHSGVTAVAGNSTVIVAANLDRRYLRVDNSSVYDAYCKFGEAAISYEGIVIPATTYGIFIFDWLLDTRALNCLGLSGSSKLAVAEGSGWTP